LPRKTAKNVFAADRDVQADAPSDPTTLLPKVGQLPPPPPLAPASAPAEPAAPPATSKETSDPATDRGSGGERAKSSRPRGVGGRPTAGQEPADGITKVPARVPAELYAAAQPLVKGVGKPSWGQLIAWTCQDHKDAVVTAVLELARTAGRRPRGQNQQGTPGLQVTARLDQTELPAVDEVLKLAAQKADRKVTRTMVVIASLTVATQRQAA